MPTPREMIAELDRTVIGQEEAKRALASAVYTHYLAGAYAAAPGAAHGDLGPQHVLLLGPTGSGKTLLVRALASMLGVPIVFGSATALAEVGYKGDSVDTLVRNLVEAAGGDVKKAERGIIYLDEFDKLRRVEGHGGRDVSGEGVQNALLTLLDGRRTTFSETHHSARLTVDVSKILFVCTGAFSTLPEVVRRRRAVERGFGFGGGFGGARAGVLGELSDDEAYQRATAEDLIACGFIPELVGRFASIAALRSLTADSMRRILDSGAESILAKQRTLFGLHGVELEVGEGAMAALAERSAGLGVGARGLVRVLLGVLRPVSWRLPDLRGEGVVRVRVTEEAALGRGAPELVRGEESGAGEGAPLGAGSGAGVDLAGLRARAVEGLGAMGEASSPTERRISDVRGWPATRVAARLEDVKRGLDWENTTGSARKWWGAFEKENGHRLALVLRLAEELLERKATVTEFFLAYVYSNTDNIQANLHYLDYTRLKKREEERRRKEAAARGEAVEEVCEDDLDEDLRGDLEDDLNDELDDDDRSDALAIDEEPEPAERGEQDAAEAGRGEAGRGEAGDDDDGRGVPTPA